MISTTPASVLKVRRPRLAEESGIFAVLLVVALVLSILSPNFRTFDNVSVLLVNGTVIAFLALGQTFVLLTGGIDLSTGSNVAMTGANVVTEVRCFSSTHPPGLSPAPAEGRPTPLPPGRGDPYQLCFVT